MKLKLSKSICYVNTKFIASRIYFKKSSTFAVKPVHPLDFLFMHFPVGIVAFVVGLSQISFFSVHPLWYEKSYMTDFITFSVITFSVGRS